MEAICVCGHEERWHDNEDAHCDRCECQDFHVERDVDLKMSSDEISIMNQVVTLCGDFIQDLHGDIISIWRISVETTGIGITCDLPKRLGIYLRKNSDLDVSIYEGIVMITS